MFPTRQGSFRLFRLFGIDVYLHWYWFLWAAWRISSRDNGYTTFVWNAVEYISLFVIVLMHEFGHSLACKSVGGKSELIVLWPFGGVAYVNPPQRPGATLWSIAAGPLVNVLLAPVFHLLAAASRAGHWGPDAQLLFWWLLRINYGLLIFNLLPVYPLDGGQILRSLLWFVLGRAKSLMVTSVIGFIGTGGLVLFAVVNGWWLTGAILLFIALPQCIGAYREAQRLKKLEATPRYAGFTCPGCRAAPVAGDFWSCAHCHKPFDMFLTRGTCPHCQATYATTSCTECGRAFPFHEWLTPPLGGGIR